MLGDLGVMYFIYRLVSDIDGDNEKARKNSLLFFLCPFVIFISSIWGMFDSIPILFTIISMWLLLKGRLYLSSFFLGMGTYFKVVPIIYLPILAIYIIKRRGFSKAIVYSIIAIIIPIMFTLIPVGLFRWDVSKAFVTVLSQTERTGDSLVYWNLRPLLNDLSPSLFPNESLDSFFSFPLIRYLWILGLLLCYFSFFQSKISSHVNSSDEQVSSDLQILAKWFIFVTISFLLTRTFVPEQFVLYLLPAMVIMSNPMSIHKYYKRIWILGLAFVFVNFYPFAFAYLINANFWSAFSFLATTQPFSTLRYATRFMIAVLFDFHLLKFLLDMVKKT
jgi:hypothetical protein